MDRNASLPTTIAQDSDPVHLVVRGIPVGIGNGHHRNGFEIFRQDIPAYLPQADKEMRPHGRSYTFRIEGVNGVGRHQNLGHAGAGGRPQECAQVAGIAHAVRDQDESRSHTSYFGSLEIESLGTTATMPCGLGTSEMLARTSAVTNFTGHGISSPSMMLCILDGRRARRQSTARRLRRACPKPHARLPRGTLAPRFALCGGGASVLA